MRNIDEALADGLDFLNQFGTEVDAPNQRVLIGTEPISFTYHNPRERVLFQPECCPNPFFHLYFALWALDGQNEIEALKWFSPHIAEWMGYHDTMNGAPGHRWKRHFEKNQIHAVIEELKARSTTRQAVLQVWDVRKDLGYRGNDSPSDTHAYFNLCPYTMQLEMTVCGRVHDILLDMFGITPVLYSILQEYIAFGIGRGIGKATYISNGLYGTADTYTPISHLGRDLSKTRKNPYVLGNVSPYPLISTDLDSWTHELHMFIKGGKSGPPIGLVDPFFKKVASPIFTAYRLYKDGQIAEAKQVLDRCHATDWALACQQWITRQIRE